MTTLIKIRRHTTYGMELAGREYGVRFAPSAVAPVIHQFADGRVVIGYLSDDPDPTNPREDNDNFGTMVCWHRRYTLGDKTDCKIPHDLWRELLGEDFARIDEETDTELNTWWAQYPDARIDSKEHKDMQRQVAQSFKSQVEALLTERYVILPLYLYDHSGITMSTSAALFQACDSAGWDWGTVGSIYVSQEKVLENWSVQGWDDLVRYDHDHTTKTARERALDVLTAEVEEYNHYLTGDCFGVCVETFDKDGESLDDDACWGHRGLEYAQESLTEQVASTVQHLTAKEG